MKYYLKTILICLLISSIFVVCTKTYEINDKVNIAKINNEPITIKEFNRFINQNRAFVFNHFSQKFSVQDSKDFWTTDFGGEKPVHYLKEKSLNECINIKIQQMLAREKGLVQDISYSAFLKNLKQENEKRQLAVETKKVIYGPIEFTEQTYFNHIFSILIIKLKKVLAANEFEINEEKLRKFYEEHKDDLYKRQDALKIEKLSVKVNNAVERESAKVQVQDIKKRAVNGEKLIQIAQNLGDQVSFNVMKFDDSTAHIDERFNFEIKNAAMKLQPGELTDVSDDDNVHIIKCIERKNGAYIPFEKICQIVEANCVDEMYKNLIEEKINNAKIEINESIYNSIKIQ
jgi:hypothetical protein